MIQVTGSIKRAFIFPATAQTALAYYSELARITQFMPHISLVESYAFDQIRVLYKTVELGSYTIRIYCDLQSILDKHTYMLKLKPLDFYQPVEAKASVNTTTGQGLFTLQAQAFPIEEGDHCRVEYQIELNATLPRPLGMRLMPRRVVNRITKNITDSRIREIADGFIRGSMEAYPAWQAQNQPTS